MQTAETFKRARQYAHRIIDPNVGLIHTGVRVVSIHLVANGWEHGSARSNEIYGHAVERDYLDGGKAYVVWPEWSDAHKATYLMDSGTTVVPCYVAGYRHGSRQVIHYHDQAEELFLQPFPLEVDGAGRPRMRTDKPTVQVDFKQWMLPVTRAYHVKVDAHIPALNGEPF